MSRFSVLEKEINKGIKIDEKSNQYILKWSPNNVRRLIIGVGHAVVQYFVTGGKYGKLREVVNYSRFIQNDTQLLVNDPKKYKALIGVLIEGRVCSSIEEIIFCVKNYDHNLLSYDSSLSKLMGHQVSNDVVRRMERRFPRLRYISKIDTTVEELFKEMQVITDDSGLLNDALKDRGIRVDFLYEGHESDWWRGTYLRGRLYDMDKENGVLHRYFNKVESKFNQMYREKMLSESEINRFREVVNESYGILNVASKIIVDNVEGANRVFVNAPVIEKLQWAMYLQKDNVAKCILEFYFKGNKERLDDVKRIDVEGVLNAFNTLSLDSENMRGFLEFIFNGVLTTGYSTGRDKHNLFVSVDKIKNLAFTVFSMVINTFYLALVRYFLKSGKDYVNYHVEKLAIEGKNNLVYTRSTVAFINAILKNEDAKYCLDKAGATEVLVKDFGFGVMTGAGKEILDSLNNWVKGIENNG